MRYFPPMTHRVAHLVYPGFELLDASGPVSVFAQANHALRQVGRRPFYEVMAISPDGGAVLSSSGVALTRVRYRACRPRGWTHSWSREQRETT
jgi:transcriptional regulator GlxA family with amidase domain